MRQIEMFCQHKKTKNVLRFTVQQTLYHNFQNIQYVYSLHGRLDA